jgi:hypothetical protein
MTGVVPTRAQPKGSDCSICTEHLADDVVQIVGACNHIFHTVCLLTWLSGNQRQNRTCPNCRCELYAATARQPLNPGRPVHSPESIMSRRMNAQANSYSAGDAPREVTLERASDPSVNQQHHPLEAILPSSLISIASQRMYLEDNLRAAENEQTISIIESEIARAQADRYNRRLLSDRTAVEHAWDDLERTRRLQQAILNRRMVERGAREDADIE